MSRYGLKMITALISLSLLPFVSNAQDNVINLQQAIEIAKANNLDLKNADLTVESQEAMTKTAWSLGETELSYANGQINSDLIDYGWELTQDFGAPFHQSSLSNFMKLRVEQSEAERMVISRSIDLKTRLAYFNLVWRKHRHRLIERDFLQYEEATKIADLKYQSGESNLLSKVMMEAKYEELRLMLQQAEADRLAAQQELMKVLQSEVAYESATDSLSKNEIDFDLDSLFSLYERSSIMSYLSAGLKVSEQNVRVQKSTISPSLGLGYFNQSIDKTRGFDGWALSISFPLWFRPNSGQIQSAKIEYEISNNVFQQRKFSMISDLKVLSNQRNTLFDKLQTFERTSLRNADLITENAELLYRNGEIEYLEYIRSIGQAIRMKLSYLDNLHEYNQITQKMNYLVK